MSPQLPRSPTNMVINTIGLFCSLVVLGYVLATPSISDMTAIVAVCLSLAVPIIVLEAVFLKTYKNPSTGLDFSKPHQHWQFFLVVNKLLGLIATIAFVTLLYWIFPEYQGDFYDRYYQFLTIVMPLWLVVSVPYFFWVTRYMRQPKDGYWHMGKLVLLQWRDIDFEVIKQHLLGWLVKLFFLPLMFTYVFDKIGHYREADFAEILTSFQVFFDFTFAFLFYIDENREFQPKKNVLMLLQIDGNQIKVPDSL